MLFHQGPRCPAKCRDRTTAPAPAGEARISNKGKRYHLSRSESKHSPKRRRPRSRVKLLLNFQLVPRGKKRRGKKAWAWLWRDIYTGVVCWTKGLSPRAPGVWSYIKRLQSHRHCHFKHPRYSVCGWARRKVVTHTARHSSVIAVIWKRYSHSRPVCLSRSASCSKALSSLLHRQHHHHQHLPPPVLALIPQKDRRWQNYATAWAKGWLRPLSLFITVTDVMIVSLLCVCASLKNSLRVWSTTRGL